MVRLLGALTSARTLQMDVNLERGLLFACSPFCLMLFKDSLKMLPTEPVCPPAPRCLWIVTPRSPKSRLTMVSDVGAGGGDAAAMGSCSEPAASLVGGRILGNWRIASSASACAYHVLQHSVHRFLLLQVWQTSSHFLRRCVFWGPLLWTHCPVIEMRQQDGIEVVS